MIMSRNAERGTRNRGFTLLELMVVMAIISILISMTVGVIWGVRRHYARVDARMTMKQLRIGMINLKQNNNYDPMLPIGVWTSGQTVKNATDFKDLNRDFTADGVVNGDELYLLGGANVGKRAVTGVAGSVLTLDGSNFDRTETGLDYFILKGVVAGDITYYPEVNLGKELDPNNKVWKATYSPHMNGRRLRYYTCKPKRIQGGEFVDPWGHAYAYELVPDGQVIVERIVCAGADGKLGTDDDVEEVITEIPFGG
jgi:prepilin-type N-terminal cleavage/methylation domain-containing protein